ncbi:MAG: flagellar basal body-associated FliL family protein [Pseudomonadota bacterium]
MAKEDLELDLAEGEEGKKGKSKLLIIIVVLVLCGGGAAAFFLMGGESSEETATTDESAPVAVQEEVIYYRIPNPIVANIPGKKRGRVMQLKVAFQLKSKVAEDAIKKHLPVLTNKLLIMISSLSEEELLSKEGKIKLKEDALTLVRETMQERENDPTIEKILFTSLVMQ